MAKPVSKVPKQPKAQKPANRTEEGDKPVLNERQRAFVREYLVDLNATQAAIRAGYSEATAEQSGPRLLGNVGVREAIEAGKAKLEKRTGLTKDWLVKETVEAFLEAKVAKSWPGVGRLGELLAKLHGWTIETRNVRIIRTIEDLSDAELAALAGTDGGTEELHDGTRH